MKANAHVIFSPFAIISKSIIAAIILLNSACSSDISVPQLSSESLLLKAGQKATLTYSGEGTCLWKSENELIATVDNYGNVEAHRVGETKIFANNLSCKVTVTPTVTLMFVEPLTKWGATKSEVKAFMNSWADLEKETTSNITYSLKLTSDIKYAYSYQFSNGALSMSGIGIPISIIDSGKLATYFIERCLVLDTDGLNTYFCTLDKSTIILVSFDYIYQGFIMIGYSPDNGILKSNTTENYKDNLDNLFNDLKPL